MASEVLISPLVRDRLVELAGCSVDGLERAGFLFGRVSERGFEITDAFIADKDRRTGSVVVCDGLAKAIEANLGPSQSILGTWHTHPTAAARPSEADLKAFETYRGLRGHARSVNFILSPGGAGPSWASPTISAWITRAAS